MSREWEFDEQQARLTWRVLALADTAAGLCAEVRLLGDGSPIIQEVNSEDQLIDILKNDGPGRMATIGVNPRPVGLGRAAKNDDIAFAKTIFVDIDPDRPKGTPATEEQLQRLNRFVTSDLVPWFVDQELGEPVLANSGNGIHVLLAIPAVDLSAHPDFAARAKAFRNKLCSELEKEIKAAGVHVDSTQDVARMLKIHGTAKPLKGHRVSRFMGEPTRSEDAKLLDLVLKMDPSAAVRDKPKTFTKVTVDPELFSEENIPDKFDDLVESTPRVRKAFRGKLKDIKDLTRSGQDLSLVSQLIRLGIAEPKALAAILYNTPHQKAAEHSNPQDYIERTIATAMDSAPRGLVPGTGLESIVGDPDFLNPAQDFRDEIAIFARRFVEKVKIPMKEGKETVWVKVKMPVTKLITSDRRVLTIKKPPKLKGETILSEVPGTTYQVAKAVFDGETRWRRTRGQYSINRFIKGKAPDADVRVLLRLLVHKFQDYVYFPDQGDHLLCALYVILSYWYRLFPSVPYIHLHGAKGSAKTTTGRVFQCLGFNGTMTTNCSQASLFRIIDRLSPLFVLDETEKLASRSDSADDPRTDLLKGGYQRGATVTRQDADNVAITRYFDIFSPKVICNIFGLEDVLADRAIRIQTRRASRKEAQGLAKQQPDINNRHWATYRDVLYCLAMQRHKDVARIRDEMEHDDIGHFGRDRELWFPLVVTARLCEESGVRGVVKDLMELAERKRKDREASHQEGEEETLTRLIIEMVDAKGGGEVELAMDDIEEAVRVETGEAPDKRKLGRQLRTIGAGGGVRVTREDDDGAKYKTRVYRVSRKALGHEAA